MMTRESLSAWLERMKSAWLGADMAGIRDLFSSTKLYYESPFMPPASDIATILGWWECVAAHKNKEIEFEILAIEGDVGVVRWAYKYDGNGFAGIYQIEFNEKGDCVLFKQWSEAAPSA